MQSPDISFSLSTESPSVITSYFSSVPTPLLPTLIEEFKAELVKIHAKGIDMVRMKTIIELQKLKTLEVVETNAADGLMSSVLAGKFIFI